MIPSGAEIKASLAGALRLLLFDAKGLHRLAQDSGAVYRSFFGLVLAAPAFLLQLHDLQWALSLEEPSFHFYAVWALIYLLAWVSWPLVLLLFSEGQGLAPRVPLYILAANWVAVLGSYLHLAARSVDNSISPESGLVATGVFLWLLANEWFVVRRTLGVSALAAVGLVFAANALSYMLFTIGVLRTDAVLRVGGG